MTLAVVRSRALLGIEAPEVTVEVHITNGLPGLSIVGLPETAVKESKDRVRSAIINAQFEYPLRRITVNLAPADLPKEGGRYDLAIAVGILCASGQLPVAGLEQLEIIGELALSGEVRQVPGSIAASIGASKLQRTLVVPKANASTAAMVDNARILGVDHLLVLCAHLLGQTQLPLEIPAPVPVDNNTGLDLADVRGQPYAKRALEVAAAGQHSLLFVGPPGSGKTMLASRLPGLLPCLAQDEWLQVAAIRSVSGQPENAHEQRRRPFRAPHHTASGVALVGGGSSPKPGEISLAHQGVLFLDELPEFDRRVLEVLREPLESGQICISRAARQVTYPARFQLIAAMNPCPCGYFGDASGRCHCGPDQVRRYQSRISGPLLDRLDMHVEVPALKFQELTAESHHETPSRQVRERVDAARQRQYQRRGMVNSMLANRDLEQDCGLAAADRKVMEQAMERLSLSARAYHRVLRVARTLADLEGVARVERQHLMESLGYRKLDRLSVDRR
ncbi:MAG: YifB family Mg chelatase-like AAA ATPase [Motiliproteus sp.]